MVHMESEIECYRCTRQFITYPAMIIHLEAGTCDSSIGLIGLNKSAAKCYQWKSFAKKEYRSHMLSGYDLCSLYSTKVFPFECPECCSVFTKLSGLFQHVYSDACSQQMDEGKIAKLIRWLENEHEVI